ncbi:hypothetical protein [Bradyrhizobium sp. CCGB01]|uniref:hypothetical protein n=1 Tax=Bradyrhizobium sp. CCGB01 TaxID=2949634 RepID=UPI0020B45646|nr:hypothetical protein [Bradyrhizobium sp. CCGB01]MCP3411257.1 hypothetical protein [Bradyrhizobium sp. CCGB01]
MSTKALRLSPRDISAFRWLQMVGFAKVQLNADAEAVASFRRSLEANRNYPITHFGLAVVLALLFWMRREPLRRQDLRLIQALPSAGSASAQRVKIPSASPDVNASMKACFGRGTGGMMSDLGHNAKNST